MCLSYFITTVTIFFSSCGWCDDGQGTGIGSCKLGGASSPLVEVRSGHRQAQWVAADTCPASEGKSWHFTSCPGKICEKETKIERKQAEKYSNQQ